MKRIIFALIFALPLIVGCGIAGTSSGSSTKTTLYGELNPPSVAPAITGQSRRSADVSPAVTYQTDTSLLKSFVASGTCRVNGIVVGFAIDTGTKGFRIEGLDPADAYDIKFELGSFTLQAIKPYTGSQIPVGTVNLNSTANALLYENYGVARKNIKNYEIQETYSNSLAGKLLSWLQTSGQTPAGFAENLRVELASYSENLVLGDITNYIGQENDVSGTWKGSGTLYTLTNTGTVGNKAKVELTMIIQQNGKKLSGLLDVTVISSEIVNKGGKIPVSGRRDFVAELTGTTFTFDLGTAEGKQVERWSFALKDANAFVCKVENLDKVGYLGLQSSASDLPRLQR